VQIRLGPEWQLRGWTSAGVQLNLHRDLKTAGNCCPVDDESHRVPIRAGEAQRRRSSARLSGGDYGSGAHAEMSSNCLNIVISAIRNKHRLSWLLGVNFAQGSRSLFEVGLLLNVDVEDTGSEQARDRSSQHFSTSKREDRFRMATRKAWTQSNPFSWQSATGGL